MKRALKILGWSLLLLIATAIASLYPVTRYAQQVAWLRTAYGLK